MECWSINLGHCTVILNRPTDLRIIRHHSGSTSGITGTALEDIEEIDYKSVEGGGEYDHQSLCYCLHEDLIAQHLNLSDLFLLSSLK